MNNFSKMMVLTVAAFAMTACGKDSQEQHPSAVPTPVAVTKVDVAKASEFPAGFAPSFGYRVRSKREDLVNGERYRKLVIEFKGGEAEQIDSSVEAGLEQLGYRRYKTLRQDNGAIVGDYGRQGHRVTVTTTPLQPYMSLFDPEAKGTVYFVWKP